MSNIVIAMVGCSKSKNHIDCPSKMIPARDLYSSDLFKKRVEHVEGRDLPWYIISACGGLTRPMNPIRTYDKTLKDLCEIDRAAWDLSVANELMNELYYTFREPALKDVTIEIHAGKLYSESLSAHLKLVGLKVVLPVANLGIGEQLAYYKKHNAEAVSPSV